MVEINVNAIPTELKNANRWILWRKEGDKKPPVDTQGRKIDVTKPENWLTFDEAIKALSTGVGDGIGFVLGDGFAGIDLDDCLDEGGNPKQWAKGLIRLLSPTYCEVSPSGKGVKLFFKTDVNINKRKGGVEIYASERYFTVTGAKLEYVPSALAHVDGEVIENIMKKLELIYIASQIEDNTYGEDLQALFKGLPEAYAKYDNDESRADLGFLAKVIIHCGLKTEEELDFLFRLSGLYRPKWDDIHSSDGLTYGQMTIRKALQSNKDNNVHVQVLNLAEFLDYAKSLGNVEWLVEGLIPQGGVCLVSGRPKRGKSTLARQLLTAIALEQPALALDKQVKQTPVVITAGEDYPQLVASQLLQLGVTPTTPIAVATTVLPNSWKQLLEKVEGKAVLLDPANIILGIKDVNDYSEVYDRLSEVREFAKERGITLILTWHDRKPSKDDSAYALDHVLGSTALTGAVDVIANLTKPQGGAPTLRKLVCASRLAGEDSLELDYCDGVYKLTNSGGLSALALEVFEFLSNNPGVTQNVIRQALHRSGGAISNALMELRNAGRAFYDVVNSRLVWYPMQLEVVGPIRTSTTSTVV